MESTEQTGRTVDEAVETALRALGVSRDQVEVEILSEEKRGLLGILGSSSARVRVTVKGETVDRETAAPETFGPELEQAAEVEEEDEEDEYEDDEEHQHEAEEISEPSELAERAADILREIIRLMGLEADVEIIGDDPEAVSLDIRSAEDLGLLIGKRGQTLASLQLIVAIMANRPLPLERRRRVILDAEGYRAKRDRTLKSMARTAAQRAKRSGRAVRLNSLNPRERRIIHLALADDPSIQTRSEGEDPNRTIVVMPKRAGRPR